LILLDLGLPDMDGLEALHIMGCRKMSLPSRPWKITYPFDIKGNKGI